ncbi:Cu,Zn superoxide dismutase-like protein, partial [Rhizoclosmatium globosum]
NQSTFSGTFTLIQSASTGQIKGLLNANGLVPLTRHAIHIHSFGDTSQFDTQIGPHFNPTNTSHGCPSSTSTTAFHLGDIGSFDVDSTGSVVNKAWTLTPNNISLINLNSPGFVLGRSIAIHEKEDDCTSQPAGNSGAKIAVGVV